MSPQISFILFFYLILCSCSQTQTVHFNKNGITDDEFYRDKSSCQAFANTNQNSKTRTKYSRRNDKVYADTYTTSSDRDELYYDCMRGKGYTISYGDHKKSALTSPSSSELFAFEKEANIEHDNENQIETFIQPVNIQNDCKILVTYDQKDEYKYQDGTFKLNWDGKCQDGLAIGLGKEIQQAGLIRFERIGFYKNGRPVNYYSYDFKKKLIVKGTYDESEGCYYTVEEKNVDPDGNAIDGQKKLVGAMRMKDNLSIGVVRFPNSKDSIHLFQLSQKKSYLILSRNKDANDQMKAGTFIELTPHGYIIEGKVKDGKKVLKGFLYENGKKIKEVGISQIYLSKFKEIQSKAIEYEKVAIAASLKGMEVKKAYYLNAKKKN